MRLTITTALFCTVVAFGAHAGGGGGGGNADGGIWQWQQPMSISRHLPMAGEVLKSHLGEVVYAIDGAPVGTLESYTTENEAVVHTSMFFMRNMKYILISDENLYFINGKLYVHDANLTKVKKVLTPTHLAVGL